ncbi:YveK family protein [Paenibacillus herberti]|nr:Wzz/FepE/Etk N-terminal domain-containing protein [Paenibacillus herberti]
MDMKRYVIALKKRLWMIIILLSISTVSAYYYTQQLTPNYYSASSKFIVNNTVEVSGGEVIDFSSIGSSIRLIDTYKEIILTPAIMDKVVVQYPDLDLTANQLLSMIRVSSLNETQVMTLTATDTNHGRAVKAVNAVAKVFQTEIPKIMKINNVTILTSAQERENPRPFGQNISSNVMIAAIAALLLSCGTVILVEYLDSTIKQEEDIVQATGADALAIIPKLSKRQLNLPHKKKGHSAHSTMKAGEQAL